MDENKTGLSAYNKIWSVVGLFVLYNSVNMYLHIQGSEVAFPFPDFSKAARDTVSIYSMMIYIPSYYALMKVTSYYLKMDGIKEQRWFKRFPIAFNLSIKLEEKLGINYQRFFIFAFLILPACLQVHSLKEYFSTYAYTRDSKIGKVEAIATNFWEHLTNWQPNPLANDYIFGDPKCIPVTYFPVFESWFFLICETLLFYMLIRNLILVFKKN